MAFTVKDYQDFATLLAEHPEWQSELRRLVLSAELLTLPETMRQIAENVRYLTEAQRRTEQRVEGLAEAQRRSEERLTRLEESVAALTEAQRRSEERLTRLEESVAALIEAQRRSEERLTRLEESVAALIEAQQRTERRLQELTMAQQRTDEQMAKLAEIVQGIEVRLARVESRLSVLDGRTLEMEYREKAYAYFGFLLRRLRVVPPNTLEDTLETHLSFDEVKELLRLDLLLNGRPRERADLPEVWLAVEISVVVDENDVTRARRRAELLRKAGYRAIPVVAGQEVTLGARAEMQSRAIVMLQDGKATLWDEALAKWVA
jgi:hypothetical protein